MTDSKENEEKPFPWTRALAIGGIVIGGAIVAASVIGYISKKSRRW